MLLWLVIVLFVKIQILKYFFASGEILLVPLIMLLLFCRKDWAILTKFKTDKVAVGSMGKGTGGYGSRVEGVEDMEFAGAEVLNNFHGWSRKYHMEFLHRSCFLDLEFPRHVTQFFARSPGVKLSLWNFHRQNNKAKNFLGVLFKKVCPRPPHLLSYLNFSPPSISSVFCWLVIFTLVLLYVHC